MKKHEAIQEVREELIKQESLSHDKVENLKATCEALLSYIHNDSEYRSANMLLVEISEILASLDKIEALRNTLSVLENID